MTTVAIVYHSGYGHTQRMAQAVAEGAAGTLIAIDADGNLPAGGWEQLKAADAIIFGSPTYMGSASWQFKKFADASSKPWFSQDWKDKLFAGFTNSAAVNGDKLSTLSWMVTLAMQHGGIWVGLGILPSSSKAATRNDPNYLGSYSSRRRMRRRPRCCPATWRRPAVWADAWPSLRAGCGPSVTPP
jgi:NAD(P)H dehydrogenase (quinone)